MHFTFNASTKVKCPQCNSGIMRGEYENHTQKCSTPCKLGCGEKVSLIDQSNHEKNDCAQYIIECNAKNYYCDWKGARYKLQDHLKQCQFHTFAPLIKAFKDEINSLLVQQSNEINALKAQLNQLSQQNVNEINSLKLQIQQHNNINIIKNEDFFTPAQNYTLSNNNKTVTKNGGTCWDRAILGNNKYSKGFHQWTLRISYCCMIGVAPFDINRNTASMYVKCGWYLFAANSTLCSGPPMMFNQKKYPNISNEIGTLKSGSTVIVKLDMDSRTISFIINGIDYGVAFDGILVDKELCLCGMLYVDNDSFEILR